MGTITLGLASSHAFAVMDPSEWDEFRERNRRSYERRYGNLPPSHERVTSESDSDVSERYATVRASFERLRALLTEHRPDALIFVADDQNENFTTEFPQLAVYGGEQFWDAKAGHSATLRKGHPTLAQAILERCVRGDIEMTSIKAFPDERLFAHAFGPVLQLVDPEAQIPIVPVFVNAIHEPSPSPARCLRFGQAIRAAVEHFASVQNVAIYASGGLSHFTAGYPWKHYHGPFGHGAIDEPFDRELIAVLKAGRGSDLTRLTGDDLLAHGEIELRSWIVALGALGDRAPEFITYEPFYRAMMGMGVAAWT